MTLPTLYKKLLLTILSFLIFRAGFAQNLSVTGDPSEPFPIEFLPEGGFFNESVTLQLLAPGAAVYYTTDGSRPAERPEQIFRAPFQIQKTTVVRAFAVVGGRRSKVISHTYFIDEPESTLPVVSLSITSSALFDPDRGLFVKGPDAVDSLWNLPGANFWSRRELSANFEFFETNGKCVWRDQIGIRVFGGMSRLFPQKSIALVARKRYGDSRFRYRFFGKKGLKKYKFLVLRNSGSDFGKTHFRDGLMTQLVKDWDLDVQDYRPAQVYINGVYWGIYNLREKINRYYVASHYDVKKDSIDLLEHLMTKRFGSTLHYRSLLSFLERNSLANDANFEWVKSMMDVNNFMEYQIAQIYFDNQDAGGNIKYWRPKTENGRWRWILYDTDYGFGLYDSKAYRNNSLAFHTDPNGPNWPNPPWSTFILRKLLENKAFEQEFINCMADHLNDDLQSERVLSVIEKFYRRLLPEMPRHLQRWRLSEATWNAEVNVLRNFARERPAYLRKFLQEKFDVGELRNLSLDLEPGGRVVINENIAARGSFQGQYFEKVPVRLKAVADLGYHFVGWEGEGINSSFPELYLQLSHPDWRLRAVFEKYRHPLEGKIVINEISCNNKKTSDWIEIYNNSKERVNLKDWILADRKNEFRFPSYTLPPKGYIVVCEDSARFLKVHPNAQSVIGGLSFGLNKRKEIIQLFSADAEAVDSMGYELPPMDSVFTLNLLLPGLDNGDPDNWELTPGSGSPGAANAYYLASRIQTKRSLFMQIGGALAVAIFGLAMLWLRKNKFL